jgi:hypothetical protein
MRVWEVMGGLCNVTTVTRQAFAAGGMGDGDGKPLYVRLLGVREGRKEGCVFLFFFGRLGLGRSGNGSGTRGA